MSGQPNQRNLFAVLYPPVPIHTYDCMDTDSLQVCSNLACPRTYPPVHGYEKPPGTNVTGRTQILSRGELIMSFQGRNSQKICIHLTWNRSANLVFLTKKCIFKQVLKCTKTGRFVSWTFCILDIPLLDVW